jgi:hypothetical protein
MAGLLLLLLALLPQLLALPLLHDGNTTSFTN